MSNVEGSSSTNRQNEGQNNSFFGIPFANIHAERMKQSIGNFLPTAALANLTTKKYTLPDKNVASQVLMYRQLLHTACKPGLRLSRAYQGTSAQKAVKHMPVRNKKTHIHTEMKGIIILCVFYIIHNDCENVKILHSRK